MGPQLVLRFCFYSDIHHSAAKDDLTDTTMDPRRTGTRYLAEILSITSSTSGVDENIFESFRSPKTKAEKTVLHTIDPNHQLR